MRTPTQLKIGQFIVDCEARRDAAGKLKLYKLPAGDGGGDIEIAGINDRYHPAAVKQLVALLRQGKHLEAELAAIEHILDYTDTSGSWASVPAIEAFLRDTAFNRGPTGCAKILQMALRTAVDGKVGPNTRRALAELERDPKELIRRLRAAREAYERKVAPPTKERAKFWKGLLNRWDKVTKFSLSLLNGPSSD